MNIIVYVYWVYCLLAAAVTALASMYFVHALQNGDYAPKAYMDWVKSRFRRDSMPLLLTGIMSLMLKMCNIFFGQMPVMAYVCFYGADVLYLYMIFSVYLDYRKKTAESPMRKEGAAIRTMLFVGIVAFLCAANLMRTTRYLQGTMTWGRYMAPYVIGYLPGMLIPLLVLLGVCITAPKQAFGPHEAPEADEDISFAEDAAQDAQDAVETAEDTTEKTVELFEHGGEQENHESLQ